MIQNGSMFLPQKGGTVQNGSGCPGKSIEYSKIF